MLAVKHTAATVNHQVIWRQVLREIISGYDVYVQPFSDTLPEHIRDFFAADILFERCMSTGLRNKNPGAFGQMVKDSGA